MKRFKYRATDQTFIHLNNMSVSGMWLQWVTFITQGMSVHTSQKATLQMHMNFLCHIYNFITIKLNVILMAYIASDMHLDNKCDDTILNKVNLVDRIIKDISFL